MTAPLHSGFHQEPSVSCSLQLPGSHDEWKSDSVMPQAEKLTLTGLDLISMGVPV